MYSRPLPAVTALCLIVLLCAGCTAPTRTLYQEHFLIPVDGSAKDICRPDQRGNYPPACFGWKAHSGLEGDRVSHTGPLRRVSIIPEKGPDGLPGRVFAYLADTSRLSNQDILFWTDEFTFYPNQYQDIEFSWLQYDDHRVSHRLAVGIDTASGRRWFASTEVFRHPSLSGLRTPYGKNLLRFDAQGFRWIEFPFKAGGDGAPSPFDVSGGTMAGSLPTGAISAFGIYLEMNSNQDTDAYGRIDDFWIVAKPR